RRTARPALKGLEITAMQSRSVCHFGRGSARARVGIRNIVRRLGASIEGPVRSGKMRKRASCINIDGMATSRVLFSRRAFRMPVKLPSLSLLHGVVATEILEAMKSASAQLAKTGVRHALVGALAAGAWGYPRASKDIDFLVGDEAFERHAGG